MPTYEYVCRECGQHTEAVQAFTDDPLTVCPHCGGPLRKVFGNIGIAFKGSGFYKNDSRSTGATKGAPAKADGAGDAGSTTTPGDAAAKSDSATTTNSEPAKTETKSEPSKPAAAAS